MKECKSCTQELPFSKFSPSKMTKDGYEGKCRVCRTEQRKKHKKICGSCNSQYETVKKDSQYCSSICAGKNRIMLISHTCLTCKKEFEINPSRIKGDKNTFCSKLCWTKHLSDTSKGENNRNYNRVLTECFKCRKEMKITPSKKINNKYHFCSKECYVSGIGETMIGELNHNYIRVDCTCAECEKTFKRRPSEIRGETFCSNDCRLNALRRGDISLKVRRISINCFNCQRSIDRTESKLNKSKAHYCSTKCKDIHFAKTFRSGENAYNYSQDKSLEDRMKERNYPEYRVWRTSVYARDNYTCVVCKDSKGGNLIAHHLFSYAKNPTLRTEISNGITLCVKCHSEFHGHYGYYNNTEYQFDEFKKSKIS